MSVTPLSKEELARRKAAREQADRAYNDALTAVDAAVLQMPSLPGIPGVYDESQMGRSTSGGTSCGGDGPARVGLEAARGGRTLAARGSGLSPAGGVQLLVVDHLNRTCITSAQCASRSRA